MATLLHAESRRLYSWWWDSHISPKNSKWLQENLTDMDVKVKTMIKLLEEDADSFARRAEMYYKKRPELMKLVEEFYRAYRALAERYDHATVELRQAHRTMAEAFPNQIPFLVAEDSPAGSSSTEAEPHTPEMPHHIRAFFDLPDDLQKEAVGLSSHFQAITRNGAYAEDSEAVTRKKGLKQLNELFTFEGADSAMFAEGRARKGLNFQEEERKESSEYKTHDGSRDHSKLEVVDKEDTDSKTRSLQDEVSQLSIENQDLKTQVALKSEHVGKAENDAESLRQALSKLQSEEEAARLQYQQCLERLSNLEDEISRGQEEVNSLKHDILMGATKLNGAEGRCLLLDRKNQLLQSEVDTLVQKNKMQQEELLSNHKELEKLSIFIQDEHLHRVNSETTLQSLEHSHSQSQEEKRALKLELQQGLQMLKDTELMKQGLEDEVRLIKEENHILNEQNLSSTVLIKNLQDEISSLKEMKGKLEEEARLSIHQKNALQHDFCCLKEDKDDLNRRYQDVMEQLESIGSNATCLQLSVKDLQDENLKLKDICQKNDDEKVALLEKLENMEKFSEKNMLLERSLSDTRSSLQGLSATLKTSQECYQALQDENLKLKEICQKNDEEKFALLEKLEDMEWLLEKNMLLERSLSDTSAELQGLRAIINTLKESYHSLQDEKLELKDICQKNNDEKLVLLEKLENMEKLSEKNILLESSLSDASAELQMMRATIKMLEDSYQSLHDENLGLKEICQKNNDEKLVLLEKVESMEKVLEKNVLLENSVSDASAELQRLRENLKTVEESFHSIQDENLELREICQKNDDEKLFLSQKLECMERLSEKNMLLEISLSDTSSKLQELQAKLKKLEESFQSLQEEKYDLVTEKNVLVAQVESITQNMENLSGRNALLENSLSYMNVELEGLRAKSKNLEECCQCLQDEKTSLLAERNDLLFQVDSIRPSLEDLEKRHKELENNYLGLEKDRELTLHHVDELQVLLNLERQEYANSIQSRKTECATLENQLQILQEEAQWRKKDLEEELDKVINAQIETFVLQRCIHDINERNLSLSVECQKHVDASTQANNMILELEKENLWQQEKTKSLLEQSNKLKMVIHQVLKVLDISVKDGCLDRIEDRALLPHILEVIKGMQSSVLDVEDENQLLIFEKFINSTLLEQLRLEAYNLKTENYTLSRESELRDGKFSMLQAESHKLLEKYKQLELEVQAGIHREEVVRNEMGNLHGQFSNLRETYQTLQDENHKLLDRNLSLTRTVSDLEEENFILQEENDGILREAMTQANLSLIFESISAEKAVVLKALNDDVNSLCGFNRNLKNEIIEIVEETGTLETENIHLKESIEKLEEYKIRSLILLHELNMIRNINDQLNNQIEIGKNLLSHKEVTLLEVGQKLEATQSENAELRKEIEEGRSLEEHLESELLKKLNEAELWERENAELLKEIEEHMIREEYLESELLKKINEVELREREVVALYEDLLVSDIRASLFEEKALELIAACKSLQESAIFEKQRFDNEGSLINSDVEGLKRQVSVLEGENLGLNAEMAAYLPLILSLKESMTSLEHHALYSTKVSATDNQKLQDSSVAVALHNEMSSQELSEYHSVAAAAAGFLELQNLQAKVQAVEKVVTETMRLAMQESSNAKAKLEEAMEEIKDLKLKSRSVPEYTETRKDVILLLEEGRKPSKDLELQRNDTGTSQSKHGLTMKDIQLDHVSDSSSHGNSSYGMGRRRIAETEDQMLELWETAEQDCDFEPTRKLPASAVANEDVIEYHQIEAVEEQKSEYPSSELQSAKELAVDEPEVSKKSMEPHQDENVRVVERLASDARRLMNLQTSVKELKKKTDKSIQSNRPSGFEYDNMKGQLKEVEEAILQLVDSNRKLTKKAEDGSASASDSKVEESVREMGNVRKQRVLERVQKSSERIGRLELEVQRIQFILLKLEDQHKSKGTRVVDRKTTVLLRDYLYAGRRSQGKKKVPCCACIRPATKGE